MNLHQAKRSRARMRIALAGPSGTGKTYSALLLAYGITGDWSKICIIDTEQQSADLYSELGSYYVLSLSDPFTPERYVESIKLCEASGIEVIIIDSITHEWNGKGGCLEQHEQVVNSMKIPNSFQAWGQITPRHQAFIDAILQSPCHVISTVRSKTDYIITERNGKNVPVKVGLAPITREGFDYEQTIQLDIDEQHMALSSKDRTGLFTGKPKFRITSDIGQIILKWCNQGDNVVDLKSLINNSITIEELKALYDKFPEQSKELYPEFNRRKREIQNVDQMLNGNAIIGGNHGNAIS